MIIVDLIYNLSVLVALSVLSAFLDTRFDRERLLGKVLQGLLFGLLAIIGMLYPLVVLPGLIFDGRTIIVSLGSLYYGPLAGALAAAAAILYRGTLGGPGLLMGIATVVIAYGLGCLFFRIRSSRTPELFTKRNLYYLGLLVHAGMVLSIFLLPRELWGKTFQNLAPTIIIVYPVVTVLIGKILADETERKQHLAALEKSADRYRTTLSSIADAVIATDEQGKIEFMNHVAETLTGWKAADALGLHLLEVFSLVDEKTGLPIEIRTSSTGAGDCTDSESSRVLLTKDGQRIPIAESRAPIQDSGGRVHGSVLVFRDVTEQRQASKRIVRDLEEKKILLREIHHRVKNNLQVIISLLHLRMEKLRDPEAKREFRDFENRIHAMARAQELLYQSKGFSRLDLRTYLDDIVTHLVQGQDGLGSRLTVGREFEELAVDMDVAIVLGQIVTELFTNSLRHAFPDGRKGTIRVQVKYEGGAVVLVYEDNGVGLPSGKTLEEMADTGLHLVFSHLRRKKQGDLAYESSGGLRYRILFPL